MGVTPEAVAGDLRHLIENDLVHELELAVSVGGVRVLHVRLTKNSLLPVMCAGKLLAVAGFVREMSAHNLAPTTSLGEAVPDLLGHDLGNFSLADVLAHRVVYPEDSSKWDIPTAHVEAAPDSASVYSVFSAWHVLDYVAQSVSGRSAIELTQDICARMGIGDEVDFCPEQPRLLHLTHAGLVSHLWGEAGTIAGCIRSSAGALLTVLELWGQSDELRKLGFGDAWILGYSRGLTSRVVYGDRISSRQFGLGLLIGREAFGKQCSPLTIGHDGAKGAVLGFVDPALDLCVSFVSDTHLPWDLRAPLRRRIVDCAYELAKEHGAPDQATGRAAEIRWRA